MLNVIEAKLWMRDHAHEYVDAEGHCSVSGLICGARKALNITSHGYATTWILEDCATNTAIAHSKAQAG